MANLRLSTIPLYTDIQKREILKKYIDVQDEFTGIVDILEMMGQYVSTDNKEYQNVTQDQVFKSATVAADGGNTIATTATGTVTLVAGQGLRATVGDFMILADGSVGYITAISTDALTVYNPNAGNLVVANDAVVTFPTSGIAEGTSGAEMPVVSQTKRSNHLQYFDTYTESTDIALGSKVEVDFNGVNHFFQLQSHLAFMKHRAKIGYAFIMGKKLIAKDANNADVPMTRGLNSYVTDYGVNVTASTNAAPVHMAKTDWRTFSRALDAAKSPAEGMLWCGGDASASIDDVFDVLIAGGAVDYGAFGKGNSKQKAVDMGIKSFTLYDRTFHKSKLKAFEHSGVTSTAGSFYPDTAYFVPSGQVGTVDGSSVNRIQGRYLNLPNGLAGRYHEIETGGLAEMPTDRTSTLGYTHKSWEGLEINGPEHFGKFKLYA